MKKTQTVLSLLLIVFASSWSIQSLLPAYRPDKAQNLTEFSTDRALLHVQEMSKQPHGVGVPAHNSVKNYIISELEKLGLQTSIQQGYTAGNWANLSKAENIVARIKGTGGKKALLLLSHYDSNLHSSFGASDAASGVATILEGVRAFLQTNPTPKNDIILLISDAEEIGLNGANLFVEKHPWAKDVGLVLNFEARGSGGASYMLMETNRGNHNLVKEFVKANPQYPVANSLAYSIYKMLPNDTDLTVFREKADIEGFNFAFIDDHYDYHTANDTYERLDKNTLAHQGSYLMPLLKHFSNADVSNLKSLKDNVYFTVPFFKMVYYPFHWIIPMLLLAFICFIILISIGFRKKALTVKDILKGFIPMLFSLLLNAFIGYFSWSALQLIYPEYKDMLHGFTYNGHAYIFAFTFVAIGVCFYAYHKFKVVKTSNLLIAPILLWLLLCTCLALYLKGASFFIIPVFSALVALYISINQKSPNVFLLVFLCVPAIFIFAPFIKMFPVGLGLKMMVTSTLLTTLVFFLMLPLFTKYRKKGALAFICFLLFGGFMVAAHFNASFTKERPRPTSLVYVLNTHTNKAMWATYDTSLSDWTQQYISKKNEADSSLTKNTLSSKYKSNFTFSSEAPVIDLKAAQIEVQEDTIFNGTRRLKICVTPQRNIHKLELFTNDVPILKATVNNVPLSPYFLEHRKTGKLVTHYISDITYTELLLEIPVDTHLEMSAYEISNDLLENPLCKVLKRPNHQIPMPFVVNDAIITIQKIKID